MISPFTIEKFNNGDERAFKEIFDEHYQWLHLILKFDGLSTDEIQDAIIESFFQLWLCRDKIYDIKGFLCRCSRNLCINKYVRKSRRSRIFNNYLLEVDEPIEIPSPDIEEKVEPITIRRILANLPKNAYTSREIFKLTAKGASNADIADKLNITIRTVVNLKSRCFKMLREKIPC